MTSLGVFAGMFFFTVLIGVGIGVSNSANTAMEGISSRAIGYVPARTTMPYEGFKANRIITPNIRDYFDIKQHSTKLKDVEATTNIRSAHVEGSQVSMEGKSAEVQVFGVSAGYGKTMSVNIVVHGRDLREDEVDLGSLVCVMGEEVAEQFFKDPKEAVGKYANIDGMAYQVVGIVRAFTDGANMNFSITRSIQIPLKNAVKNDFEKYIIIMINPKDGVSEAEATDEVFQIIAKNHNVHPEDTGAIVAMSSSQYLSLFGMIEKGLFILIWLAGMGTLISGVIGVSNILLVTVRERQREIGVRRAIGAKPRDITAQFMAESIAIILLSGTAGSLLGMIITLGIGEIAAATKLGNYILRPYPSPEVLLFSAILMVVAGVLAGLLPVHQALKIKAIDAIRDE